MAVGLDMAKQFLHIDFDNDDVYIQLLLDNAGEYLRDSIDDYDLKLTIDRFVKKADLITLVLISDWYDNREMTTKTSEKVRFTIQSILAQMQYGNFEVV